jgi:signal transduction histidine kinase
MRFRTWPVAAFGLAGLLVLVLASVLTTSRRAQEIFTQLDELNTHHRDIEAKIRRLRSDVHLSGIFIRDYLLDPAGERAPEYRARLAEFRATNRNTLHELRELARRHAWDNDRTQALQVKLDEYWQAFEPLFGWSPSEKVTRSAEFLRTEVLPRREAVLAMTREMEEMNNANLAAQRAEVTRRHAAFRDDLDTLLWQSLLLGLVVAVAAVLRLRVLEGRSDREHALAEEAGRQLRELSQQLVAAQEEERRNLSRELHDHVGQMLTGVRMELGRVERLRAPGNTRITEAIDACREIIDNMVRTVRDLSLGLRPSMLDDFGLQPALEWHVRDFNRRYGLDVVLHIDGNLDDLPDVYRTCVYRTVQEALTNCVRHSSATSVNLTVLCDRDGLRVSIADNGVGMEPARRNGLGLRGIEERVRDLQGSLQITSAPGAGMRLTIRLPRPAEPEIDRARAAG